MRVLGVFSFAVLALPMLATAAEGDESGSMIQATMQQKGHDELDDHSVGRPSWRTLRPYSVSKNACIAANAATSMYSGSGAEFFNKANPNFDSFKEYKITVQGKHWGNATEDPSSIKGDTDKAWFFRKRSRCWITFMGSNSMSDFMNNVNRKPIEKWGIKGVHAGVASELEGLVNQMSDDFGFMRMCSQLRVAGHSLGGGLAQLFTLALNKEGDPLKAGLKVKELFTFGAMSAVVDTVGNNDKRSDKCFRGEQYYYADEVNGTIYADVVANALVGGTLYDPLRSKKRLLTPTATGAKLKSFKCGKPLPTSLQSLLVKDCHHPMVLCDAWVQKHMSYATLLGCKR